MITDELYHDDLDSMTFGRKDQNELYHYGIKGQSWGKRRFQNEDGSLTMAGRNRYDVGTPSNGATATGSNSGTFNKTSAVNKQTFASSNGSKSFGGASGGGAKLEPPGSWTVKTYGSFMVPGSKGYELSSGPGVGVGRSVTNKIKSNVSNSVNSGLKAANKLFSNIGSGIADTTNKATNAVSNLYTGNNHAQEAERLDNIVQNYERAGDTNINVGNQNIEAGNQKMLKNIYNLDSNDRDINDKISSGIAQRERGENQIARGEELHEKAAEYGKKADAEQAKYDNAPRQKINNALGAVSNWVGDRAHDVANAAQNAYNGTRELAGQAGSAVSNAASSVRDWGAGAVDKGRQAFENLFGRSEAPNNDSEQRFSETTYRSNIQKAENSLSTASTASEREASLRDLVNNYRQGRASGIADVRSDTRASYFLDRADNNFKEIDALSRMLEITDPNSEYGRDLKKQLDEYRIDNDLLVGEFYGNTNAAGKWGPDGININNKPDNVDQSNWDEYVRKNYPLAFVQKYQNGNLTNDSSMSDKPDGVSDEYWRDYTSNGGTRDAYERELKNRRNNQNGSR